MKKLLLCASVLSSAALWPLASRAGNYTAMESSGDTPPYVKGVEEKNAEELDEIMRAMQGAQEPQEELTFADKLRLFNGGGKTLVESRDILKGRIADRENKAIGEIKDVFVAEGGDVEGVTASLGKLSQSGEVFLSARDMSLSPSEKGYAIALTAEEIKQVFKELPKGEPDSAGGKILSARAFAGRDVVTFKGKDFGEIIEILFSEEGLRAEAALMKISYGPVRNAVVAVPTEALSFSTQRGRPAFIINSDMAAEILKFAMAQAGK